MLSKPACWQAGSFAAHPHLSAQRLHCHVAVPRRLDATRAIAADFGSFEDFVVQLQDDIIQVMQGSVLT